MTRQVVPFLSTSTHEAVQRQVEELMDEVDDSISEARSVVDLIRRKLEARGESFDAGQS